MSSDKANIAENLRVGIEAARAGEVIKARRHLAMVLKQDRNNVPALFWLTFVAPSAQESLRLLDRVLTLDPDNERAKAGVRWAKKRMAAEVAAMKDAENGLAHGNENPPELPEEFIRDQLLSHDDFQRRAKKGALAHRARRTIDPLLAVTIVLGAAVALALGVWALGFRPSETLAAWLPASAPNTPIQVESVAISSVEEEAASEAASEVEKVVPAKDYSSLGDTLSLEVPEPAESVQAEVDTPQVETSPETAAGLGSVDEIPLRSLAVEPLPNPFISRAEAEEQGLLPLLEAESVESAGVDADSVEEIPDETALAELELTEANPALSQPLSELIDSAEEVLAGPKLFEAVDESLLAHKPASPDEKWIEVDVTLQQITAWEGNVPVMFFTGSTGLPGTPTVLGEFNIYWKLEATLMAGADYYLPDVPYTMYFYGGYALHGTYWHDNFGQPMSHGCVNLKTEEAKQIFEWAGPVIPAGQTQVSATADNPGTLVVVHQ